MLEPLKVIQSSSYLYEDIGKIINGSYQSYTIRKGGSLISAESLDVKIFAEKLSKVSRKLWLVFKLLRKGYRKSEISRLLNISSRDVEKTVKEIGLKLQSYLGC